MLNKRRTFKSGAILIVSLLFFNGVLAQNKLRVGAWRSVLKLNDSTELPFSFVVKYDLDLYSVVFNNAEEKITANEIAIKGDSVFIRMPLFDSEFKLISYGDTLKGVWINHNRKDKNIILFRAVQIRKRCGNEDMFSERVSFSLKGKWECDFNPGSNDAYKAIGMFNQEELYKVITGTFSTETGDYRYLEGRIDEDKRFQISCFDGAHAFLFTGKVKDDSILNGHFYSGKHSHEIWIAKRNENFQLRNPDSLTYLKPGYSKIDFSFKNLEGKQVSLSDDKYKNKVVIIQLMGTWCPNCVDETKFLSGFHARYSAKGLEVIALAFERTDDFNKAVTNVKRLKDRYVASYDFLITMKNGAQQASEALPMLNKVMAFPTTIYIDKKGVVRKIYTGYYGPATGDNYTKQVEETTRFVEKLLAEE